MQEMERLKWEKQRDERLRQQIRENSIELRELEGKLRAGYMNKERAAQLAEKDTLRYLEEEKEAEVAAMMKNEHDKAVEMEKQKEVERWERSVQYQEQLERQLVEQVSIRCSAVYLGRLGNNRIAVFSELCIFVLFKVDLSNPSCGSRLL